MKKLFLIIFITLIFVPLSVTAQEVSVQQPSSTASARGLQISPFLMDLDVAKGKHIASQVDIINRSESPLAITVTPRDFLPGMDGQPEFVPDIEINDPTFSLATWIVLGIDTQFIIQPGQKITVPFTLQPPQNAEDGAHYGALLFSYAGVGVDGASEIQQSVGTIILVTYGVGRESGENELSASTHLSFNPTKVNFQNRFTNTGNVHVQPKGEVYIKNMWGKVIATPFVNRDAANVLPKTERTFISTWYPSSFSFGRYVAESNLVYGRGRLETRQVQVIWILPFYFMILIGLAVSTVIWFAFHGRHVYKRRVIRKHIQKNKPE